MSLIKCNECGSEISDKAASCQHCGCPVNMGNVMYQEANGAPINIPLVPPAYGPAPGIQPFNVPPTNGLQNVPPVQPIYGASSNNNFSPEFHRQTGLGRTNTNIIFLP